MTIQTETSGSPRIRKNREVKKAREAFGSEKLETDALLQRVSALKNIVKYAKVLREEADAS